MSLVLVTGGAGFIGSHTVDRLVEQGFEVRILDNLQKPVHMKGQPTYLNRKAEFVYGDVRDRELLLKTLQGVEYIFHFAAYQDYLPDFSTFFSVNAVGTALIYELTVEHHLPVKKIVVASSQFVQGEGLYTKRNGGLVAPTMRGLADLNAGRWDWFDEYHNPLEWMWTPETHANPPNSYAISKYTQELQALRLGKRYDIPTVVLRYSIVQGARQSLYNAYSGACRIFSLNYLLNKTPTIYEDGKQSRDFVNIHDVVDANLLVLRSPEANYEVFNVGGGKAYTILEFDRIVATEFDRQESSPNIPGEFRLGDTRNACSDISKLKLLGWSPKRTAKDSVTEYKLYLIEQTDIGDVLSFAEKKMKDLDVVRRVVR